MPYGIVNCAECELTTVNVRNRYSHHECGGAGTQNFITITKYEQYIRSHVMERLSGLGGDTRKRCDCIPSITLCFAQPQVHLHRNWQTVGFDFGDRSPMLSREVGT
jgi:hypothetical protein